ncbi:MAG: FAD-binding oxidoreductase, partial [Rhodoferax sp.]|nr:FAD-binding oxidoreductase [Rhodoferax sp.]
MSTHCDVIVLGAGMAGASVSAELAPSRSVVLLEREDQPGRHATGRSAAMYFASYGNPCVRALTRASHAFLAQPPAGFCDVPLLSPRSALFVADLARLDRLTAMACGLSDPANLHQLDARQARGVVPILHPDWIGGGLLDTSGSDIDVAALHQGYLRAARRAGVQLVSGTGEIDISRRAGNWNVSTP